MLFNIKGSICFLKQLSIRSQSYGALYDFGLLGFIG